MAYFGVNLAGFNVINYLARNVDYMLIGWWWGAAPLGFYERAYRLLMLPIQQINMPIAAVAIPSLSRLQNEPKKYVRAYEAMLGKLVYASGALIGLMMVTADWIVVVVFGEQWLESIPIFQWLSLVAVRQMFINTTGWLFISQGRSRELFQWACIGTPIIIASFVIGLPYGPTGVAMSYAILPSIVSPPILFWMLGRSGPMSASDLWKFFLHAVHIPVVVGTVAGVVRWILQPESEILGLLVIAPVAALTALILMLATCYGRRQLREAIDMLRQIRVQKR